MKKFVLILMLLAVAFTAAAQNNAYGIDDACFPFFTTAEHSVDDFESDVFETAMQQLLETAVRKKDTKAQTLYYVDRLKRTSHLAQHERNKDLGAWDGQEWNRRLEEDKETVQRIARATGYMQYYYYASELCQTYYYNTAQSVQASAMLSDMMAEAKETGDQYAMWKTLIYLAKLYQRTSDRISTQKYLLEAVHIYETSQDPTIQRQSMTLPFCDLADTYPVASDSARLFYRKAEDCQATRYDTLRVNYYKAQLAAWDNDLPAYRLNRDYCRSVTSFPSLIRGGSACLDCMDKMLAKAPFGQYRDKIQELYSRQQLDFLSSLAAKLEQWEASAAIQVRHVSRLYSDIYFIDSQRLEELSAQYGHHRLSEDLEQASKRVTRISILVAVLLILLASGILLITKKK